MTETERKAFKLLKIAEFILARTPMVQGYGIHQEAQNGINQLSQSISAKTSDLMEVVESNEWEQIRSILEID